MTAPIPACEEARIVTLGSLNILDTLPEREFDGLVEIARALLDVPIAYLSFVDRDRQWLKARLGVEFCDFSRDIAFCAHAILGTEPLIVPDATQDPRFAQNPMVTGEFGLRFYLGVPVMVGGQAVGTICCADVRPREADARQMSAMEALGRQTEALLEARLRAARLAQSEQQFATFLDNAPAVAYLKDEEGRMRFVNRSFGLVHDGPSVIGRRDGEYLPEAVAAEVSAHDARVRETGQTLEFEERVPLVDGTPRIWQSYKFPVDFQNRRWLGGVSIDVTTLRETEETVHRQTVELARRNADLGHALEAAEAATEAARLSAIRFEQLFDGLPVACYTHDAAGTIFEWNAAAEALWGIPSHAAFGGSVYDVVVGEANRETHRDILRRVFEGEAVQGKEWGEPTANGETRWLLTNTFPLRNPSGAIVGAVSANVDITERKRMEAEIRASEARFRTVVASLHEGLTVQDVDGQITLWNPSAARMFELDLTGTNVADGRNKQWRIFREDGTEYPPSEMPIANALRTGETQTEIVIGVEVTGKGLRWLSVNAAPLAHDGAGPATEAVSSFVDITERRNHERLVHEQMLQINEYSLTLEMQKGDLEEANRRLEALATTDGLTGLKNHRFFQDFLRRRIDQCRAAAMPISVALLDVDKFKSYNDDFGHQAGDAVLQGVADTLERSVRTTDLVARYGGEEFVIVMPGLDAAEATAMAERVRERLEGTPFQQRAVTASFGVATLGPSQTDATSLIRAADEALYRSKESGRNRVTHGNAMAFAAA